MLKVVLLHAGMEVYLKAPYLLMVATIPMDANGAIDGKAATADVIKELRIVFAIKFLTSLTFTHLFKSMLLSMFL